MWLANEAINLDWPIEPSILIVQLRWEQKQVLWLPDGAINFDRPTAWWTKASDVIGRWGNQFWLSNCEVNKKSSDVIGWWSNQFWLSNCEVNKSKWCDWPMEQSILIVQLRSEQKPVMWLADGAINFDCPTARWKKPVMWLADGAINFDCPTVRWTKASDLIGQWSNQFWLSNGEVSKSEGCDWPMKPSI